MTDEIKDNKKILVIEEIEDDNSLRKVLHDKLKLEGFSVLEAKDGEEGLSIALSQHPDLILLDVLMPKIGGIEMLKKLREDTRGKDIPVIIFSNFSEMGNIASAIELSVNDYLVKSNWTLDDILVKIKEKLKV